MKDAILTREKMAEKPITCGGSLGLGVQSGRNSGWLRGHGGIGKLETLLTGMGNSERLCGGQRSMETGEGGLKRALGKHLLQHERSQGDDVWLTQFLLYCPR